MNKFKVGDRVVCVVPRNELENVGDVLTVRHAYTNAFGRSYFSSDELAASLPTHNFAEHRYALVGATQQVAEVDPNGIDAHTAGAKLDAGKLRPSLVLGGFARALKAVTAVGTFGATKYTDNGWMEVPNGLTRYDDAKLRHWLDEKSGIPTDKDTGMAHAAHEAWNALARLDLMIREQEKA